VSVLSPRPRLGVGEDGDLINADDRSESRYLPGPSPASRAPRHQHPGRALVPPCRTHPGCRLWRWPRHVRTFVRVRTAWLWTAPARENHRSAGRRGKVHLDDVADLDAARGRSQFEEQGNSCFSAWEWTRSSLRQRGSMRAGCPLAGPRVSIEYTVSARSASKPIER